MSDLRGGYDVAFDRIETQLKARATADAATSAALGFTVTPDAYRYQAVAPGAYVYLYLSNLSPVQRSSAAFKHYEYDIDYLLDLMVEHRGDATGQAYARGDALAGKRLRYLMQQVIVAMTDPAWADMGFAAGTVTNRRLARFEPLPPEIANQGERPIIGARATMSVRMSWDPARLAGVDLDELHVDAGQFTALYEYGGNE